MPPEEVQDEAAFLAGAEAAPVASEPEKEPPVVETPAPEGETEPEAAAEDGEQQEDEAREEKPKGDNIAKRIGELTRQRYDAERAAQAREVAAQEAEERARRYQAAYEAVLRGEKPDIEAPKQPSQSDLDRLASERAQQIVAQQQFQEKFTAWDSNGVKEDPKFREKCATLADLGASQRPDFVNILLDLDNSHRVAAELAADPDEALRILSLPSHKMAMELTKRAVAAAAVKPAPPASKAPPPIKPVAGKVAQAADDLSDNLPIEKWMRLHDEQQAKRVRR